MNVIVVRICHLIPRLHAFPVIPGDLEEGQTGHSHPCMGLEPDNTGNTTPTNSAAAVNVEPVLEKIIT